MTTSVTSTIIKRFAQVAGGATLALAFSAGAVSAETECQFSNVAATEPGCSTDVDADTLGPSTPGPAGPAANPQTSNPGSLPVTGGDALTLAVVGAGLVGGGVLLVSRSRRMATD